MLGMCYVRAVQNFSFARNMLRLNVVTVLEFLLPEVVKGFSQGPFTPCRNFSNFFLKTTISEISIHISLIDTHTKMWTEITDIVVFGKKLLKFL